MAMAVKHALIIRAEVQSVLRRATDEAETQIGLVSLGIVSQKP